MNTFVNERNPRGREARKDIVVEVKHPRLLKLLVSRVMEFKSYNAEFHQRLIASPAPIRIE